MTALTQYDRLESIGLWRLNPDAQRREVVVSFGNATLVMSDTAGRPLAHWSLPAITRLNPGKLPALFSPDDTSSETLEIEDDVMIDAIGSIRGLLEKGQPKQGRGRLIATVSILALAGVAAVIWLPDALRAQAATVVHSIQRAEIGATVLGHMQAVTGPRCQSAVGDTALARLATRLLPDAPGTQIIVLPGDWPGPRALPGGLIVLDAASLVATDDPAAIAGQILFAAAQPHQSDPVANILAQSSLAATLRLVTAGAFEGETLKDYANTLLTIPAPHPDVATLVDAFDAAQVPVAPFSALRTTRGRPVAALDKVSTLDESVRPILSDLSWVGLQGICDN